MGTILFVRESTGVSITPAGTKLLSYARNILILCEQAVLEVSGVYSENLPLVLSFISTFNGKYLVKALENFRLTYPGTNLVIKELSPSQQISALKNKKIDVALLDNPCSVIELEFDTQIIYCSEIAVAVPEAHFAAKFKNFDMSILKNEAFIGYDERSFPMRNRWILDMCKEAGFTPNFVTQVKSLPEMFTLIGAGIGVALVTYDSISLAHPNTVFISPDNFKTSIKIVAAWRKNEERTAVKILVSPTGIGL